MAGNFLNRMDEKRLYEEFQARERADEIAKCLVYEAFRMIEQGCILSWRENIVLAFANLRRVSEILGESCDKVSQELLEVAKKRYLTSVCAKDLGCSEQGIDEAAYEGEYCAETHVLPREMGEDSIHHGFVAEMFSISEVWFARLYYIRGVGWRIERRDGIFNDYPLEKGIKGLIYSVMRGKIDTWRWALEERGVSVLGVGGWLEKLEKNINDPEWLAKVEELILVSPRFGVEIVSGDA